MGVRHWRVTLLGHISGGLDNWSCSFSTAPVVGGSTQSDLEAAAALINTHFDNDLWTPHNSRWSPSVTFDGTRISVIEDDGKVSVSGESIEATPIPGAAATGQTPPECAIVVSLRTATPGPRGRGRMYLPAPASGMLTSTGMLNAGIVGDAADGMQAFINHVNAETTMEPVGVASMVGGGVSTVTSIRVGNVMDSQRRRRSAIAEAYQARGITP